jgi:hypothetical protein
MTPDSLVRLLEDFLADSRDAVVLENGEETFDFSSARYSISGEHGKCLLHLWSAERNTVRRVLEAETKRDVLTLTVQRFGQAKPSKLEICRERDRRPPSQRKAARSAYQSRLRRLLERNFPDFKVERLSSAMDLERSFGPAYARGLLRRGRTASAVLGVNAQESQGTVDGALTIGLLWLDDCRQKLAGRAVVEGLRVFVPAGCSAVVRERMAHLDRRAALRAVRSERARELALASRYCRPRQYCDTFGAVSGLGGGAGAFPRYGWASEGAGAGGRRGGGRCK